MKVNNVIHKIILLIGFLSLMTSHFANALSQTDSVLEVVWAATNLNVRMLDNTVTEKYCGYSSERFLGCAAAVEQFGQYVYPNTQLIYDKEKFKFVVNLKFWQSEPKAFIALRRKNFEFIRSQFSATTVKFLIDLYSSLRTVLVEPKPYQVATAVNESLAVIFDPHRQIFPMFKYNGLNHVRQNPYMGVSTARSGNQLMIDNVFIGSSAESAGLKVDDIIIAANDKEIVIGQDEDLSKALIFEPKSVVKLKVKRSNRIFETSATFDYKPISSVNDRFLTYNGNIFSYLHLSEIPSDVSGPDTCEIFKTNILQKFQQNSKGLILDFRQNAGGAAYTAACITGLFIGSGFTIFTEMDMIDLDRAEIKTNIFGPVEKVFDKPVVVLTSANTASASEAIVKALQFYGRAYIVGDRTFGKAVAQYSDSLAADRIDNVETSLKTFGPDGVSIQSTGIEPDFKVFRNGLVPSEREQKALREEDIALYPLRFKPIVTNSVPAKKLVVPAGCIKVDKAKNRIEKMDDKDWKKDLQLEVGLNALECLL